MALPLSLTTCHDYLVTPPLSSRETAPHLRRHHSTPSWSFQTPTPQYYYASTVDMYSEFSRFTDGSYPITPVSDEEYRSQFVVVSPHLGQSSPQSSGTITPEMLRTVPGAMLPSPLATPDVVIQGITHSCVYPGCAFVSSDVENVQRHAAICHQTPKQVPPPSLVMDDNGVASVSFVKRGPPSPSSYLQEGAFEDDEEEDETTISVPAFSFTNTPLYPISSLYGMSRSNTLPSSTPTHTPTNISQFCHPYTEGTPVGPPVTQASNPRHIHSQYQLSHSLSDPSLAASIALLPSQHAIQYMSPLTPSKAPTPRRLGGSASSNLPLVVSALDKSHVCEICQKRFKRLEHLRRHNKTHTGERGFRCEVVGCGKWFSRSDNLMAHRRYSPYLPDVETVADGCRTHGKRGGRNIFVPEMAATSIQGV